MARKVIGHINIPGNRFVENKNNTLAIVSIVHNQSLYIEDWIKFHYLAGVKDFYFYIDNCTDNTVEIIDNISKYLKDLKTTIIPWTIKSIIPSVKLYLEYQSLSYVHAIFNYGDKFNWMTFIDTDEYLVPIGKKTIVEAISHLQEYSNISLLYTMFGSNGFKSKPEVSDIFAYTKKVNSNLTGIDEYMNTKCIIKPSNVDSVYIHKFTTNDMGNYTVNDIGKMIINKRNKRIQPNFVSNTNLQLNHYCIRSNEEFTKKIKWHENHIYSNQAEFLYKMRDIFDNNAIEDNSIKKFLVLHEIRNYGDFKSK